jgi:hypothetical protein
MAWFGCLCGLYLFGQGLLLLRRRKRTSAVTRVCDAKAGPILVGGWAERTETLNAALSGKPCFYYRATVWRQEDPTNDDSWEIVAEETQGKPFVLSDVPEKDVSQNEGPEKTASRNSKPEHDKYGRILVDPRGAQVDLLRDTYEEYGKTLLATFTDIPSGLDAFLKRNKVDTSAALRVEEYLLSPGAETFVHGVAIANPVLAKSGALSPQEKKKNPRDVSGKIAASAPKPVVPQVIHLSPETANRPATEMTMQSRVAAALALARTKSPEAATPNPLHIPSISVVAEANATRSKKQIQAHAHTHAFNEGTQQSQTATVAAPASKQPTQPPLVVRQQDGSRFTISYRNQSMFSPSSLRRASAFLVAGPLIAIASIYLLLTILGLL